ncbi:MAG: class I SAM-dependent methyltransferase [Deltaproteobacteria bacterium]|jgi:tellurite methyltransferase
MGYNLHPDALLLRHRSLFTKASHLGPVLDLACGDGHNGLFLAAQGVPVILCDVSPKLLEQAKTRAQKAGVKAQIWEVDLEASTSNPLQESFYGGIVVFRYLHRPLIPCIKKALKRQGVLAYETFTTDQPQFGKPHNPHFLLKPGEMSTWFEGWCIIHYFEGIMEDPKRAVAQIVCRKPGKKRCSTP